MTNDPKNPSRRHPDYYTFWSTTPTEELGLNKSAGSRIPKRAEDYEQYSLDDPDVDIPTNPEELQLESELRVLERKYGIDPTRPDLLNAETQKLWARIKRFRRDYYDHKHYSVNQLQLQLLRTGFTKLTNIANQHQRLTQINPTSLVTRYLWQTLAVLLILLSAGFIVYVSNDDSTPQPNPTNTQAPAPSPSPSPKDTPGLEG